MRGRETTERRHKRLYFQHPDVFPILPPSSYSFVPPCGRGEIMMMLGIGNRGDRLCSILAILMVKSIISQFHGIHFATHTPVYHIAYIDVLCKIAVLYVWTSESQKVSLFLSLFLNSPSSIHAQFRILFWICLRCASRSRSTVVVKISNKSPVAVVDLQSFNAASVPRSPTASLGKSADIGHT